MCRVAPIFSPSTPIGGKTFLTDAGALGPTDLSIEIGVRLGQMNEFALLMAVLAVDAGLIGVPAGDLVKVATVLSFVLSSYLIVLRYPTPIAVSDRLRRD
jgi:hypothetical protein